MRQVKNLFIGENPRYIRCYDNGGKTIDRYTCVFTGRYRKRFENKFIDLSSSPDPYSPTGVGSIGESDVQIDKPTYSHLGKKVSFDTLPTEVKAYIVSVYTEIWN